jgi:hypothetical protein
VWLLLLLLLPPLVLVLVPTVGLHPRTSSTSSKSDA